MTPSRNAVFGPIATKPACLLRGVIVGQCRVGEHGARRRFAKMFLTEREEN